MKVGLFFGSFNPIHIGHLVIANHMVEFTTLDEVWFVVSPHNPHKKKSSLLDDYHRLEMVRIAIGENYKLRASDIEFSLPQPSYTVDTLAYINEKYPTYNFSLIMGMDNLDTLHKWKNYEVILENHEIYVYPRIGSGDNNLVEHPNIHIVEDVPIMQISATFIRKAIKDGKNIAPLLYPDVWNFLEKNNFYR
ncbi:nicotinate-nucleotide adenylyltransferase [Flavobacteriaceae bacterium UJ101]|nr:nicotinate-nucleotide adenylyltransferase [Flavobacteriaceae bacterium UJ101]